MSIAHLLPDFGNSQRHFTTEDAGGVASESELLDSYEQGYQAGWEDAIKATSEERNCLSAALSRNLHDLSFTFHEARAAMLADITSVLEGVVEAALPDTLREVYAPRLLETLLELSREGQSEEMRICVNPADAAMAASALPTDLGYPALIVEDAELAEGQVRLRFGVRQKEIDPMAVQAGVSAALAGFSHEVQKEVANG